MSYLGLTASEYSSGERRRLGGITKAGNGHARRVLIEAAKAYRHQAKVSEHIQVRQQQLSKAICDIAWRAQVRAGTGGLHVGDRQGAADAGVAANAWKLRSASADGSDGRSSRSRDYGLGIG